MGPGVIAEISKLYARYLDEMHFRPNVHPRFSLVTYQTDSLRFAIQNESTPDKWLGP